MLDYVFNICCSICTISSSFLGLTYGEFCILAFCIVQPIIVLLFGIINYKNILGKITIFLWSIVLIFYTSNYSVTTDSFLKIYQDLHVWAVHLGISYICVNFILYIIIPSLFVCTNLFHILQLFIFKPSKKTDIPKS